MSTWIKDDNGNRCSVEYFGSEEKAKAALDSLKNCRNCINCEHCSDCSYCSYCSDCSDCSYCSYCEHCSDCSYCSYCSDCSDCSDCSYCEHCSDCSYCSYCSYCSDCSGCSGEANDDKQPQIPKIENIHKAVFDAASQPEALNMGSWHSCNTTHCRAGWVVHLAGEAGYALERFHDTALAAQLIYRESGYAINACRFYDSNEDAMDDMRRLAEKAS